MAQLSTQGAPAAPLPRGATEQNKALRILAKSLYRDLKQNGYSARQVVTLSTELLGLLTADLQHAPAED
jgi:hypothetical protein